MHANKRRFKMFRRNIAKPDEKFSGTAPIVIEIKETTLDIFLKWTVPILTLLTIIVGGATFLAQWRQVENAKVADNFNSASSDLSSRDPVSKLATLAKLETVVLQDKKYQTPVNSLFYDYLKREFKIDARKSPNCRKYRMNPEDPARISSSQEAILYLRSQEIGWLGGLHLSGIVINNKSLNVKIDDRPESYNKVVWLSDSIIIDLNIDSAIYLECGDVTQGKIYSYGGKADGVWFKGVKIEQLNEISNSDIDGGEIDTDGQITNTDIYEANINKDNDTIYGFYWGWIRGGSIENSTVSLKNGSGLVGVKITNSILSIPGSDKVRRSHISGGIICGVDQGTLLLWKNTFDIDKPTKFIGNCKTSISHPKI